MLINANNIISSNIHLLNTTIVTCMHVKKFSWHKDIQDINSVTCATYIQVFIVNYLTGFLIMMYLIIYVLFHRVYCETDHYLVLIVISYLYF